jgi:signal transduction histidine kinase
METMKHSGSRRLRAGVRSQATVAAAVVVGVALVIGGLALVLLLQRSLTASLEASLRAHVAQDARMLAEDGIAGLASSDSDSDAGVLIQVLDARGLAVYSSTGAKNTPVSSLRPAPGQVQVSGQTVLPMPGDLARPLTVAQGVAHAGQSYVVTASSTQDAQEEAVATTGLLLLAGVPILMALAALVTWWLLGRALMSVELIRAQVERIGATRLGQRVPVPPSRDEIAHLASTMNDMLARLEASSGAQRRFVADASHELRSPLATLTASLELARQDPSGRVWQDLSPILEGEAERMRHLVDDLLLLSKVDDRGLVLVAGDVDLDDLAEREALRLRRVGQVGVTLRAAPTRVLGDEHQLAQVVRNLVDNAARAATSQVRLSVRLDAGEAVLSVEDDGPGVAVADRERIFDRFVRLDESRSRASGGAGLGLSIAREIVRGHGGVLSLGDSRLGGAAFDMRIPLRRAAVDPSRPATRTVPR